MRVYLITQLPHSTLYLTKIYICVYKYINLERHYYILNIRFVKSSRSAYNTHTTIAAKETHRRNPALPDDNEHTHTPTDNVHTFTYATTLTTHTKNYPEKPTSLRTHNLRVYRIWRESFIDVMCVNSNRLVSFSLFVSLFLYPYTCFTHIKLVIKSHTYLALANIESCRTNLDERC